MERSISDFSDEENYINSYENLSPTTLETNEESTNNPPKKPHYKKWINSKSNISNINQIFNSNSDSSSENISSNEENKNINIKNKENSGSKETREDLNSIKKNIIFKWEGNGNKVKITGSFCDWKIKFDMEKDPNDNLFKCQLPLDNKKYYFKFIVDDEWKYSTKYNTEEDHLGNINNIIDLTNNSEIIDKQNKEQINKAEIKLKRKENIYNNKYPSNDNLIHLQLPNKRYYQLFKLEKFSNQKNIGKELFINFEENNFINSDTSYKSIFPFGHVYLNHLISKANNKKMMYLKNCLSFRFREKTCTFLYYK